MTVLDKREEGFERMHALGEELRFKALARRNKLIALWAADKLALSGDQATELSHRFVDAHVGDSDPEALALEIETLLAHVTPPVSGHRIRRKIDEMTARATEEIAAGG